MATPTSPRQLRWLQPRGRRQGSHLLRPQSGGPDTGPRAYVMGGPDAGRRVDVMGRSDLRFVDSLFTRGTAR